MKTEEKAPADIFMAWIRLPGPGQALLRWCALIPGVALIFLFSQLIILIAVSLFTRTGDQHVTSWLMNMLNAAFLPYLVIRYGTPIAPSYRRGTSIALAVVGTGLVAASRLAFELSHPSEAAWRYTWLAVSAMVCCASVWRGMRDVNRKLSLS
jgi:hypothetical protein